MIASGTRPKPRLSRPVPINREEMGISARLTPLKIRGVRGVMKRPFRVVQHEAEAWHYISKFQTLNKIQMTIEIQISECQN